MGNSFKEQAAKQRAAIPQVDPQGTSAPTPVPLPVTEPKPAEVMPASKETEAQAPAPTHRITIVDTSVAPVNRGFFMYPSRHRQVAKDLVYIEDRKPWQIIEDALEEYVVRHYGKEYKRK